VDNEPYPLGSSEPQLKEWRIITGQTSVPVPSTAMPIEGSALLMTSSLEPQKGETVLLIEFHPKKTTDIIICI